MELNVPSRDSGTSQPSASPVQPEPDADDLLLRELTSFSWFPRRVTGYSCLKTHLCVRSFHLDRSSCLSRMPSLLPNTSKRKPDWNLTSIRFSKRSVLESVLSTIFTVLDKLSVIH